MSEVIIRCTKCGIIGFFTRDEPHDKVNKIVMKHKVTGHRIKVKRVE